MRFEVINRNNVTVMNTEFIECIPSDEVLQLMSEAGHKFKVDKKIISRKKISRRLQRKIWIKSQVIM